ncbi:MAG: hypothetical protein K6C13_04290 [Oscillospiraceae bacterium]|nr:hypothetical protein [Oscillospiraceae bacterium]
MSKNTCRMIGMIMMILSVFLLIGGLYLPQTDIPDGITSACTVSGLLLLITGIIFYKILKNE